MAHKQITIYGSQLYVETKGLITATILSQSDATKSTDNAQHNVGLIIDGGQTGTFPTYGQALVASIDFVSQSATYSVLKKGAVPGPSPLVGLAAHLDHDDEAMHSTNDIEFNMGTFGIAECFGWADESTFATGTLSITVAGKSNAQGLTLRLNNSSQFSGIHDVVKLELNGSGHAIINVPFSVQRVV